MPKYSSCNKNFKNRQALGNHMKTHLDDSDDELPLLGQITNQFLHEQNVEKTCKRIHIEDNNQERNVLDINNKSIEKQDHLNSEQNLGLKEQVA